jgi:hypothetical protein
VSLVGAFAIPSQERDGQLPFKALALALVFVRKNQPLRRSGCNSIGPIVLRSGRHVLSIRGSLQIEPEASHGIVSK